MIQCSHIEKQERVNMTTKTATKFTKAQQNIIDTLNNDSALYVDEFSYEFRGKNIYALRIKGEAVIGEHVRNLNAKMVAKLIEVGALVKDDSVTAFRRTRYVLAAEYMQGEGR
jgi:hypothetical protein